VSASLCPEDFNSRAAVGNILNIRQKRRGQQPHRISWLWRLSCEEQPTAGRLSAILAAVAAVDRRTKVNSRHSRQRPPTAPTAARQLAASLVGGASLDAGL
jgi:hypothetical protein